MYDGHLDPLAQDTSQSPSAERNMRRSSASSHEYQTEISGVDGNEWGSEDERESWGLDTYSVTNSSTARAGDLSGNGDEFAIGIKSPTAASHRQEPGSYGRRRRSLRWSVARTLDERLARYTVPGAKRPEVRLR